MSAGTLESIAEIFSLFINKEKSMPELIIKVLTACRRLLLAKGREAVHFNISSEFQSIADFCMHLFSYGPYSKILPKLP